MLLRVCGNNGLEATVGIQAAPTFSKHNLSIHPQWLLWIREIGNSHLKNSKNSHKSLLQGRSIHIFINYPSGSRVVLGCYEPGPGLASGNTRTSGSSEKLLRKKDSNTVWSTPGGKTGVEAQMQGRCADTVGRIKKDSPKHKARCCGRAAGRVAEGMTATEKCGVQWSWSRTRQVKDTAEAGAQVPCMCWEAWIFFFLFFGATNHGGGVARLVNTFTKTKAANGACFLIYLSLLGASKAI